MTLSLQEIKKALSKTGKDTFTIEDLEQVFEASKLTIMIRLAEFELKVEKLGSNYPLQLREEFCEYWTEHGEKDRKMRFEKQKSFDINLRLKQWARRSNKYTAKTSKSVNQEWL